jgi:hypothetical protein
MLETIRIAERKMFSPLADFTKLQEYLCLSAGRTLEVSKSSKLFV